MALWWDALRGLLSPSDSGRIEAHAAVTGRLLGSEGRRVWHSALGEDASFQVWHFPKRRLPFAVTMTLGAARPAGFEFILGTQADHRDEENDRWALLLGLLREEAPPIGECLPCPEAAIGRSVHRQVLVSEPTLLEGLELRAWRDVVGAELRQVVMMTSSEHRFVLEKGPGALLDQFRAQAIAPLADRRPGELRVA